MYTKIRILFRRVEYVPAIWHIRLPAEFYGISAGVWKDSFHLVSITMLKSAVPLLSCASSRHFGRLCGWSVQLDPLRLWQWVTLQLALLRCFSQPEGRVWQCTALWTGSGVNIRSGLPVWFVNTNIAMEKAVMSSVVCISYPVND